MERGTFHESVLRNDRKVVSPADSFVFIGFALFAASVFEAVFLCPVVSVGAVEAASLSFTFSDPFPTLVSTMNDNTILSHQMVAAASAATRKYVESEGF
ncbi:hypothetical protein Hsw_3824 [Hymenobacter swuensis DY53]|uniref:Uncharacterized protein n=2 Tax=Hymenobacter TaxID=89966 RepID=W8F226_9BACT|nr:hypothetical protein Hsw_3824 [Hymenobacter swuensis DY53]